MNQVTADATARETRFNSYQASDGYLSRYLGRRGDSHLQYVIKSHSKLKPATKPGQSESEKDPAREKLACLKKRVDVR